MRKIENFDKITEAGEFQQLPAGVYGAVITNAIDVTDREYLEIYWDVAKGEYAHYFKSLVDAGLTDSSKSIRSYKDSAVRFFKSFITAIEKTNSGYEWDWNEKSLIGKKVMVVVGEEEYIDKDGNVILVRQYRYGVSRVMLEIPAGKLNPGEDPEVCAVRELKDETGMIANKSEYLLSYHASAAYINEKIWVYYTDDMTAGEPDPDPGEHVEVVRIPFDKVFDMVMNGEISDVKTQMAVMKAALIRKGSEEDIK